MKTLPDDLIEQINAEYALASFETPNFYGAGVARVVTCVIWRNPETGEIRKRPTGIGGRFARPGFTRGLVARWLQDERRRGFERLAAGTRFLSSEEWRSR